MQQPTALSPATLAKLGRCLIDDGARRYIVDGVDDLTYTEAYDRLVERYSYLDDQKRRVFTHHVLTRIKHLNEAHLSRRVIRQLIAEKRVELARAAEQQRAALDPALKPETTDTPAPHANHSTNPRRTPWQNILLGWRSKFRSRTGQIRRI